MKKRTLVLILGLVVFGCDGFDAPMTPLHNEGEELSVELGKMDGSNDDDFTRVTAMVDRLNAVLKDGGSDLRLDYPWLFRVGVGTDPWGRLRTGSRWTGREVDYVLDESDYTADVATTDVDATLERSFGTWNLVTNSNLFATRVPDDGGNFDILDGIVIEDEECIDVVDSSSPNLLFYDENTGNVIVNIEADIVVGGWIDPAYFSDCLGSSSILGVTWSFSIPDQNGDNYRDRVYVEQFYNPAFAWTTTDAAYLNFGAPVDIESVALHENGHAHGLGHFGGPVRNAPFVLKPNLKVYTPEAVMNPGYLGGEQREPLPTDVAAMRTLYGRNGK